MAKEKRSTGEIVVSPIGTLSYPSLFSPRVDKDNPNKKPAYETLIGFTPEDQRAPDFEKAFGAMTRLVIEAAKLHLQAHGETATDEAAIKALKDGSIKSPIRRDNPGKKGFPDGTVYMSVKRWDAKPGILTVAGQPIIDPAEVYGGVRARVSLSTFWSDHKGNQTVSFGLSNVLKVADGERIGGGGSSAEEDFASLLGQGGAPSVAGLL